MGGVFRINDIWGYLGAGLVLVLVYLLLNNGRYTVPIVNSLFQGIDSTFRTLQGR